MSNRQFRQRTQFTGAFASFPGVHKYDGSAHVAKLLVGKGRQNVFSVSVCFFLKIEEKLDVCVYNVEVVATSNGISFEDLYMELTG